MLSIRYIPTKYILLLYGYLLSESLQHERNLASNIMIYPDQQKT